MSALLRLSLTAVILFVCSTPALAQEMAENPFYKFWSKSKVGASVTLKETTKLSPTAAGGEKSEDVKLIVHKLVELTAHKAVVETVVTEGEVFGFVESAPTKHIYPAKMNKEILEDLLRETGAKSEDAVVKVGGKEYKVRYLTGTMKGKDGDEVDHKLWLSDEVPGAIVKRVRTSKVKGEVVAETTIEIEKFSKN